MHEGSAALPLLPLLPPLLLLLLLPIFYSYFTHFQCLFGSYKHSKLIRLMLIIINALRFACFPPVIIFGVSAPPSFSLYCVVYANFTHCKTFATWIKDRLDAIMNVLMRMLTTRIRHTQNFRSIYFQSMEGDWISAAWNETVVYV